MISIQSKERGYKNYVTDHRIMISLSLSRENLQVIWEKKFKRKSKANTFTFFAFFWFRLLY